MSQGEEESWITEEYWNEDSRVPEPGEIYFHYRLEELISKTNCGFVFIATDLSNQNAKKCIKFSKRTRGSEERIQREVDILRELNHPNIIKLEFYAFLSPYMISVTDYCIHGNLYEYLKKYHPGGLEESIARNLFRQMLESIKYIHGCNIWHRDIKPQNFFISEWTETRQTILLADFGFAKRFADGETSTEYLGTKAYMAPEMFSPTSPYRESADIWALGITFFNMLLFLRPLPDYRVTPKRFITRVKRGLFFLDFFAKRGISQEAQNLFEGLCKVDPELRMTAQQALCSSWFDTGKKPIEQSITDIISESQSELSQHT